jgi:hypothetical protein
MSREEDAVRAVTRAIAATVREVPPLDLEPAPGTLWSPGRGARRGRPGGRGPRLRPWLAPLAAAAVIVAVAVSLVLVRGNQNVSVVPPPTPTVASPGAVPRYYVALDPVTGKPGSANGLQVGDTRTGQTLARVTPPAHTSYASVTAAADDRTFLIFATESGGSGMTGWWYRLVLAPGTEHVVTVTSTAIGPQAGVVGSALSGSGRYLAVAGNGPAGGEQRVAVFSVATGRPLRAWSTRDAPALWTPGTSQQDLLTWIDGDRAIAFSARDEATGTQSVRRLNVSGLTSAGLGDGDLIADSQLIWSTPVSASTADCRFAPPLVSADGQAITCVTTDIRHPSAGHSQWTVTWRVYHASAQAPASGPYTIAYQVTRQEPGNSEGTVAVVWVSPSGSALIGEWAIAPFPQATPSPVSDGNGSSVSAKLPLGGVPSGATHVGVMSHGTFTPLPLPPGIVSLPPQAIAW